MELGAYFDRIGYRGPREPGFATLDAMMRAHVAAVPFENLDVQLGRPLGIGIAEAFDKIVTRRRGGWCYEQNGLFGWALGESGFAIRRLCCGVMRAQRGDAAMGNHLALAVTIDGEDWLADVGFGGSQAAPIRLAAGGWRHAPYDLRLERADARHWRFTEMIAYGSPFGFDIADGPADEGLLGERCLALQTEPDSPFVQNLVVQLRQGDAHLTLRGRMLGERRADRETRRLIDGPDELVATLGARFGLDVPEAASLWDRVCERHAALFGGDADALSA